MPKVTFHYADVKAIPLQSKTQAKRFIEQLFSKEKKQLQALSYIMCSDEYLLGINQNFLQHDYYTDIITFDLSKDKDAITGEIYISIDRVKENAVANNVSRENEMLRVLFHGALHLCGYGDKTKREITNMRNKEDEYLRLFEKRL